MNYYGNNDYRNYLAHYGRKGMKKGRHLPGTTWWKDLAGSVGSGLQNAPSSIRSGLQNAKWRAEDVWNTKVTGADYKWHANRATRGMQYMRDERNDPYVKMFLLEKGEYKKSEDRESKYRRLYNNSLKGRAEIATRFLRIRFNRGARKVSSLASSAINAGKKFIAKNLIKVIDAGDRAYHKYGNGQYGIGNRYTEKISGSTYRHNANVSGYTKDLARGSTRTAKKYGRDYKGHQTQAREYEKEEKKYRRGYNKSLRGRLEKVSRGW